MSSCNEGKGWLQVSNGNNQWSQRFVRLHRGHLYGYISDNVRIPNTCDAKM